MNKRTLSLSLLIGAALAVPTMAMAAPAGSAAVKTKATAANSTVEVAAEVESTNTSTSTDKSETDKFSPFAISETQTISRARVTGNLGQQPMTTEIKAPLEALKNPALKTTKVVSADVVLDAEEDLTEVSEEDDL